MVETLFESELFGHVRGAFTGATDHKQGLFEAADGGTLFLDEIGELPLSLQAKLLRVLEDGAVQRVGATDTHQVDTCVFAATNRDLTQDVATGRFRSDLLFRLNAVEVALPPLRNRREDIPYLTSAFVADCARRLKKPVIGVTAAAERILASRAWDGNIRELRNTIERGCMLAETPYLTDRDVTRAPVVRRPIPGAGPLEETGDERERLVDLLRTVSGNKQAAARSLGISRRAFYRRLGALRPPHHDPRLGRPRAGVSRAAVERALRLSRSTWRSIHEDVKVTKITKTTGVLAAEVRAVQGAAFGAAGSQGRTQIQTAQRRARLLVSGSDPDYAPREARAPNSRTVSQKLLLRDLRDLRAFVIGPKAPSLP